MNNLEISEKDQKSLKPRYLSRPNGIRGQLPSLQRATLLL
jgi:hypothetical protein